MPIIGIPFPIYIDISNYTNELSQVVQYWQSMLSVKTLLAMIEPMVSLLGLSLSGLLPAIPYLNLNILDMIMLSPNDIKNMVADALNEYGQEFLNALSAFLPIPIYFDFSIPAFEINIILKSIYNMSISSLIDICTGLIDKVLDKLKISAVLTLPMLPSLEELQSQLMAIVKAQLPSIPEEFLNEFEAFKSAVELLDSDINALLSLIVFPQLPTIQLPSPFFPDFSSLSIELREAMNIYMQEVMAFVINKIVGFVKSVLGVLGVQFPSICIDLPELSL